MRTGGLLATGTTAVLVAGLRPAPDAQAVPGPTTSFAGATPAALPTGSGRGTATALGGLGVGGKADLLATVKGVNTPTTSLGDDRGGSAPATSHTADTGTLPTTVALRGLNGGGRPDVAVGHTDRAAVQKTVRRQRHRPAHVLPQAARHRHRRVSGHADLPVPAATRERRQAWLGPRGAERAAVRALRRRPPGG
ncbi:hypothetical protein [Streptomyces sp. NBC_00859]|uniref:hypothetical protein n=1 Tax=Streptomyces sp. NBC_00859 TaxID=2903682 RepID=UPI00386A43D2|nr:hypothetical protein OG584_05965 [Streptomyces sp. NBC_00859]